MPFYRCRALEWERWRGLGPHSESSGCGVLVSFSRLETAELSQENENELFLNMVAWNPLGVLKDGREKQNWKRSLHCLNGLSETEKRGKMRPLL